mmetsp:Transcript_55897/g.110714  ORF Transcript_55897/g.110714 Transcript_55897/m.110714 type:complete len:394 (+) Transcript_55897:70-1251(+)
MRPPRNVGLLVVVYISVAGIASAFSFVSQSRQLARTTTFLGAREGGGGSSGGRKGLNNRRGTYGENGAPVKPPRRKRNGSRGKKAAVTLEEAARKDDDGDDSGDPDCTGIAAPEGQELLSNSRLLHAMLRVPDVRSAARFWEGRGTKVLSGGGKVGKGATIVGFGAHRDTEHFALELTPALPAGTSLRNSAIAFMGLSAPQPPSAQDEAATDDDDPLSSGPFGYPFFDSLVEVRSVAHTGPKVSDPFAALCLRAASPKALKETAEFYCELLGMREVDVPWSGQKEKENERCFRYLPLAGGTLEGFPTTLIFQVAEHEGSETATATSGAVECFDHLAICCFDVDAAFAHITSGGLAPEVTLGPRNMFGTRVMGLRDPNGYDVYLIEEAGFRAGA